MRAAQLGDLPLDAPAIAQAGLRRLTGEPFTSWSEWVAWCATTVLTPVPDVAAWKGHIYAIVDPRFALFFDESHPRSIRFEELIWGDVSLDGILRSSRRQPSPRSWPRIWNPKIVIGATINGDSRAHPLRILDWYGMANDTIGGEPSTLAYCNPCGAGMLFSRRYCGEVLSFGTSGFLNAQQQAHVRPRDLHALESADWRAGPRHARGRSCNALDVFPIVVTTWNAWRTANTTTSVLSINTGCQRDYSPGAAYGSYFASADTMFPVPSNDADLDLKDRVFALVIGDVSRAYPVATLVEARVLNDILGAELAVLVAQGVEFIVQGSDCREGDVAWNAGAAVRAYRRRRPPIPPPAPAPPLSSATPVPPGK